MIASADGEGFIKLWDLDKAIGGLERNKLLWDYFDSDTDPETVVLAEFCVDEKVVFIENVEKSKTDYGGSGFNGSGFVAVCEGGKLLEFLSK